jgi:signal transduction histidine kinase
MVEDEARLQRLVAALAHKLRNRLGVIQTAAYNIKQKTANPLINSSAAKIEKQVGEASRIINGLADFSRIKTPTLERADIFRLLEECLDNAQKTFSGRNVTVYKKYSDVHQKHVDADRSLLKELITCLLNNAYEALFERDGAVEVIASYDSADGNYTICIRDNGGGISPENLPKIGEPFFSTKTDGVGLGLNVCQKVVDLHGGSLKVESEEGIGTSVTVLLPSRINV